MIVHEKVAVAYHNNKFQCTITISKDKSKISNIFFLQVMFWNLPKDFGETKLIAGFYDTLDEEVYFDEFANPCCRQRGGKQWVQPNYRGDD